MTGCICKGNWRELVAKCEPLYGKRFVEERTGNQYYFFGLVWAEDDLYYAMMRLEVGGLHLLSCVGDFEGHGFTQLPGDIL